MNTRPFTAADGVTGETVLALPRLADVSFVAFMLLIFVGLTPFALRDASVLVGAAAAPAAGAGDTLRQICFASIFALIVFSALREKGLRTLASVGPALALLLFWCLLSASWSAEPAVTLRRAILASVIALSAILCVSTLGNARSLRLWRWILLAILVVNFASIASVHQAIHLTGDPEPQLVGDWRGLYFHKNVAGSVCAITALVFFFSAWERRRLADAAICAAALVFAVMTQSKSSLFLLPVGLAAGILYRLAWQSALDRLIALTLTGLFILALAGFALVDQGALAKLFSDPEGFTGRSAIWQAELAFIRDHPWLGAGFGSFSDTGGLSPLHGYIASNWVGTVAHGHNAYLQLATTLGLIGLGIAVVALVAAPAISFWRGHGEFETAMLFSLFVFLLLHNFLETDFLESDDPAWVTFLIVVAALRGGARPANEVGQAAS